MNIVQISSTPQTEHIYYSRQLSLMDFYSTLKISVVISSSIWKTSPLGLEFFEHLLWDGQEIFCEFKNVIALIHCWTIVVFLMGLLGVTDGQRTTNAMAI